MADLDLYQGAYTGAQIDSALSKVIGMDATPTAGSNNTVSSGGVKSALRCYIASCVYTTANAYQIFRFDLPSGVTSSYRPFVTFANINSTGDYTGSVWAQVTNGKLSIAIHASVAQTYGISVMFFDYSGVLTPST